jgi:hypothetical protein
MIRIVRFLGKLDRRVDRYMRRRNRDSRGIPADRPDPLVFLLKRFHDETIIGDGRGWSVVGRLLFLILIPIIISLRVVGVDHFPTRFRRLLTRTICPTLLITRG